MWNELIYIHSFVIFWRYVWTCDWKMLGLWFELGLKHLLSRHLSRKHCCIFPASTTTSKLTSPFDVVQVNISLLFLVLLFRSFLVHGLVHGLVGLLGVRGSILETKKQIRNVLRVPKNRILVAAYNISPRQAIKEENRKIKQVWFFNIEKVNFPKLLVSSFSVIL